MPNYSGAITNLNSESKMSKAGKPFKVFSVEVGGQWFEAGFKAPGNIGDHITFEATLNYGKMKIVDGTLSKASGPSGAAPYAPKAASSGPSASGGKTFPVPKNHPDRSIVRQNAVNRAVEVLTSTGSFEGINTTTDEGLDIVAARTIGLAQRFEAYYCGETDVIVEAKRMHDGEV